MGSALGQPDTLQVRTPPPVSIEPPVRSTALALIVRLLPFVMSGAFRSKVPVVLIVVGWFVMSGLSMRIPSLPAIRVNDPAEAPETAIPLPVSLTMPFAVRPPRLGRNL